MRTIVKTMAVIMVLSIMISFIAFMMDWELTRFAVPVNASIFILLLASAIYNNYLGNKKFRQFLHDVRQEQVLHNEHPDRQAKISRVRPGKYSHYKPRKTGLNWTAGTVHGAVPKRRNKRSFLSRR